MQTINFKEEVLKVYPDAECRMMLEYRDYVWYILAINKTKTISFSRIGRSEAWQNAYNNIKNQNK